MPFPRFLLDLYAKTQVSNAKPIPNANACTVTMLCIVVVVQATNRVLARHYTNLCLLTNCFCIRLPPLYTGTNTNTQNKTTPKRVVSALHAKHTCQTHGRMLDASSGKNQRQPKRKSNPIQSRIQSPNPNPNPIPKANCSPQNLSAFASQ